MSSRRRVSIEPPAVERPPAAYTRARIASPWPSARSSGTSDKRFWRPTMIEKALLRVLMLLLTCTLAAGCCAQQPQRVIKNPPPPISLEEQVARLDARTQ